MTPLILGLGVPEMIIILAVVLLLFGGSKLAGLGKSTGRALREFKEETKDLKSSNDKSPDAIEGETIDAELVEPSNEQIKHAAEVKSTDTRRDA
jgi:sec-independent protein translocase protein TatA